MVSVSIVSLVLLGLAVAGVVGYAVAIFNSLVQVRNNTEKAFKNIDVLLQQRYEELPKLVDTCKAYMKYEQDTLEKITALRQDYRDAATPDEKTGIENEMGKHLLTLNARAEAYPDLKANAGFVQIHGRISALESSIADRREFFNDSINIYNIQIERFPQVIVARSLGYARKAFLDVPQAKTQDVKMDFS